MIKLTPYSSQFEQEYWMTVKNKIPDKIQEQILSSCQKFLPEDFFYRDASPSEVFPPHASSPDSSGSKSPCLPGSNPNEPTFEKLILAPFQKLKEAKAFIQKISNAEMKKECFNPKHKHPSGINNLYFEIYGAYDKVANAQEKRKTMRVRIVINADLTVCPYCNRDYINCRADHVSGAQLDHFFSRSEYPLFAVSLYNLVPVCANCNRVKSAKAKELASPFDETIDWENELTFDYYPESLECLKIDIRSTNAAITNNITQMRIKDAYQIHDREILEIQDKVQAYSESQIEEIQKVLHKENVSENDIKRILFGPEITPDDMKKKPLGKMMRDVYRKLKIY